LFSRGLDLPLDLERQEGGFMLAVYMYRSSVQVRLLGCLEGFSFFFPLVFGRGLKLEIDSGEIQKGFFETKVQSMLEVQEQIEDQIL
jgi:hypothetical protein